MASRCKAMVLAAALALAAGAAEAGPRVASLDQCADQFVLALAPRLDIAFLSHRADDADSYLRAAAQGLPRRRATLEAVISARPQLVVRNWGGDPQMDRRLASRGVQVVRIEDANGFAAVAGNVRRVAAALRQPAAGEALIARMQLELLQAQDAWAGRRALYLTPGGFTAGDRSLVGSVLRAAGLTPATRGGYAPVSLERLVADPPDGVVLGFFDTASMGGQRWSVGRRAAVRRLLRGRTIASLPATILGCPGWFAADGARDLAAARP